MVPAWQQPEEWSKDGSAISGIAGLKTGAWTALFTAQETVNGKTIDIILKTFSVPEGALHDERKVSAERTRFLVGAHLQQSLVKDGATAWVKVLKVSDDPPAFTMPKYGPSLQDLLEHKINLTAKELYSVLHSVLQALMELKKKENRSHGDLKLSNVLASAPGEMPPYKVADPTPKGERHSANDLYNLGLILYQLIEHKDYDSLKQITPSKNWSRLGARRDRWIQFLNLLLSPNGCQDELADVKKEALRLKPVSPMRPALLAVAGIILVGGVGIGSYIVITRMNSKVVAPSPSVNVPPPPVTLDPQVKAAFLQTKQAYQEARTRWQAMPRTRRYDHTKSTELTRDAGNLVQEVTLIDEAGYKEATELYKQAAAKQEEAIAEATREEATGKSAEQEAMAAYLKAKQTYQEAQNRWQATVQTRRYDHTKSAQLTREAVKLVEEVTLRDDAEYKKAADLYLQAAAKQEEAITQAKAEETAGKNAEQGVMAELQQTQRDYGDARGRWNDAAAKFTATQNHTRSQALAEAAKLAADSAAQFTDSSADPAAWRIAADQYKTATAKLTQALALVPDENRSIETHAQSLALFQKAGEDYRRSKERWDAFKAGHKNLDLAEAGELADEGQKDLSEPLVLTDDASYRAAAERYYDAAQKNEQAMALGAQAKPITVPVVTPDPVVIVKHTPDPLPDPPIVKPPVVKPPATSASAPAAGNAEAIAAAVNHANAALEAQNYADAFTYYKKAADLGSAAALYNVGRLYETGTGTSRDYVQAANAYKKSAEQKYVPAILNLASLYQRGKGVDQNFTQALNLYKQAADLNNAEAMVALGGLYENGHGTEQNLAQALQWYRKAAELKNPAAITNVGVFYESGKGVPVDYKEAVNWYQKAAALHYAAAMNALAVLYDTARYDNGKDLKPQAAEALKWYTEAARLNYAPAMCNLGALYDNGQGVPLDHAEARRWFEKAAQQNHPMAMFNLGVLYEMGRGIPADTGEAVTWYRKAAHSEDPQAQRLALDALGRLGYNP